MRQYINITFIFFLFILFHCFTGLAQHNLTRKDSVSRRIYHTSHITGKPPKIDGHLDDECWKEGDWSFNYVQSRPKEGADPTQNTSMKILYDETNIYVAIRAFDKEQNNIHRYRGRRDEFIGDVVGICFDSYHDYRTGFEFDITAAGVKIDLMITNNDNDISWNAVWYGEVGIEDSAWTAEMQIPLSQLRYNSDPEQIWGLHAWRWIDRNQEEDQWNLFSHYNNDGPVYLFGELHGLQNLKKSRQIEIMPFVLTKLATSKREQGNPFATGQDYAFNAGADVKIGLSSDFTLDLTINPDFGEVEADPSEMNLSVFETMYYDKRPFFLEGKNILQFKNGYDQLFYPRRIGKSPSYKPCLNYGEYIKSPNNTTILGAMKLTGKTKNGLSVGILESVTSEEYATIHSGAENYNIMVEPLTNYFVGRIQKDIRKGNTVIGGIITSTNRFMEPEHIKANLCHSAYSGGIDFTHYWQNRTYYIQGISYFSSIYGSKDAIAQVQQSSVHYFQKPDDSYLKFNPSLTSLSGTAGSITIGRKGTKKFRFSENLGWQSPGLELNDLGYLRQADNLWQTANVSYYQTTPAIIYRNYYISFTSETKWNFGGKTNYNALSLYTQLLFRNKWSGYFNLNRRFAAPDTRILRGGPDLMIDGLWTYDGSVSTDNSKTLGANLRLYRVVSDDKISYLNGISSGLTLRISNAFDISGALDYMYNYENNQYVITIVPKNDPTNPRYILGQFEQKTLTLTLRINYNITPEFTVQYYGSPFLSEGRFSMFKKVINPMAFQPSNRFYKYGDNEITYTVCDNQYLVNEYQMPSVNYSFYNPDYRKLEYWSNLVIRWEYKPSSVFYFVWSHHRLGEFCNYIDNVSTSFNDLYNMFPDNVFLIKFSYWFTL